MLEKDQEVKMDTSAEQTMPAQETPSASHEDAASEHHSHHSHYHSRHSDYKSQHSKNRKRKASRRSGRDRRKKLVAFGTALLFCVCSLVAGTLISEILHRDEQYSNDNALSPDQYSDSSILSTVLKDDMVSVAVSVFDEPVSLINSAAKAILQESIDANPVDIYAKYGGAEARLDVAVPLKLSYRVISIPNDYVVSTVTVALSEHKDMSNPIQQTLPYTHDTVSFINLKTGTTYYYQVIVTFTNEVESVTMGTVNTAYSPRIMTVSGGYDFRDVGGWLVSGGKRIKQGVLYRGCEIDGATVQYYKLSETGKDYLLNQLNIKTEMDLRNPAETPNGADVLGSDVRHTYYNAPIYVELLAAENRETLRRVFADLANPKLYPAYIHDIEGMDSTGTVCYLLGALLGMDADDLVKDYQLSALHRGGWAEVAMNQLIERVNELPGTTLSNKVENYLRKAGVTSAQIQSIRDIFLEDVE